MRVTARGCAAFRVWCILGVVSGHLVLSELIRVAVIGVWWNWRNTRDLKSLTLETLRVRIPPLRPYLPMQTTHIYWVRDESKHLSEFRCKPAVTNTSSKAKIYAWVSWNWHSEVVPHAVRVCWKVKATFVGSNPTPSNILRDREVVNSLGS